MTNPTQKRRPSGRYSLTERRYQESLERAEQAAARGDARGARLWLKEAHEHALVGMAIEIVRETRRAS